MVTSHECAGWATFTSSIKSILSVCVCLCVCKYVSAGCHLRIFYQIHTFGKSPWSADFIAKYEDHWNWHILSTRDDLPWSIDFIKRFEKKWDWLYLSAKESNGSLCGEAFYYVHEFHRPSHEFPAWTADFIEEFEDRWDWRVLSANSALSWSEEFHSQFSDRWCKNSLSNNADYQAWLRYEVFHDYE